MKKINSRVENWINNHLFSLGEVSRKDREVDDEMSIAPASGTDLAAMARQKAAKAMHSFKIKPKSGWVN